jgi:DHA2 family multidrug resistance protein
MSGTPAPGRTDGFNRLMITASIITATLMNALDMTIANVALPHIQGSVSAGADQVTWVLTSYIVSAAIMTPLTGALAARFGQKTVFLVSVVGFTIASALCGVAQNLLQIVGFRLLQGICGAPLIPLAQAVLLDIYPREKQGQAMAVWGMASMLGPIMGPVLGGWLTDHFSWRWVFYINVPFGIASFLGIWTFVPGGRPAQSRPFDLMGFMFLAVAVGVGQLMFDRGEGQDWFSAPEIWIEAFIAAIAAYLCIVQTLTAKQPFISRELLRDRNFVTAAGFSLIIGVLMFSTTALLPPMLETLLGYPVTQAGMVLAPRGVGTLIAMFFVGRLVGRIDNRLILMTGIGLMALSTWQMTHFSLDMPSGPLVFAGLTQGLGMGLLFVPLSTIAFSTLPGHLRTEGAGLFTLIRNIGSSAGISLLAASQIQAMAVSRSEMNDHIRADNPAMHMLGRVVDPNSPLSLARVSAEIARQAAMIAYLDAFKAIMVICLIAMPILILLRPPRALVVADLNAAVE